ncbi:MAG: 1-acyl-sn-glycerol-3-phosphate acyltransferase [Bacteroidota bacterium]
MPLVLGKMNPKEKFVDVRKLIEARNKKLLKWLPGFFIRWIEKIIHQDDVNEFMEKYRDVDEYEFCEGAVEHFNLKLSLKGKENIPSSSTPCIFCSNHPLGGMDAITVIHLFKEVRPDIHFIVNDLLMHVKPLKGKFIGVNKIGKNAASSLQLVENQFASEEATFIFPAGLVSRKIKGEIMDLEWKKTFVSKAKKYKKQVIPVYINGGLTNRFYRLANIRKFLGIKLNIEMFFLVDELFRQKNMKIGITIGKPIDHTSFTKERTDVEWANYVKEEVYKLKEAM